MVIKGEDYIVKKLSAFLVLGVISVCLVGCTQNSTTANNTISNEIKEKTKTSDEIIEFVYNQLYRDLQDSIGVNLKEANINKTILDNESDEILDNSYIGKEVYSIEFPKKDKRAESMGKVVYASVNDKKVVGYATMN